MAAGMIRYPNGVLARAPHLSVYDAPLVQKYVDSNFNGVEKIEYDLPVETANVLPPETDETIREMWAVLRNKRIDLVIHRANKIQIAEAKPRAGAMAVGQVLMYADMYKAQNKTHKEIVALLITDEMDRDIWPLCVNHKIEIYETEREKK